MKLVEKVREIGGHLAAINDLAHELEGGMKVLQLSASDLQAKHDEVEMLNASLADKTTSMAVLMASYTELKAAVDALRARFA